jgi:HNH endonuclease
VLRQLAFDWMDVSASPSGDRGRPFVKRESVSCAHCGRASLRRSSDIARNTTGRFFCNATCLRAVGCRPRTGIQRPCERCGASIYVVLSAKKPRRFCSRACKSKAEIAPESEVRTCRRCRALYRVKPSQRWHRALDGFCSRRCQGDASIARPLDRQHNGRCARLDRNGYVLLWEPAHPKAIHGWVYEHRLVVERRIGRPLSRDETVHHANGIKDDNRDANLVVLSRSVHSRLHGECDRYVRQQLATEIHAHERAFLEQVKGVH